MKKVMSFMLILSMLVVGSSLSFARAQNDSILSDESNQSFLDSILGGNLMYTLRSELPSNFVYSGTDKTFYTKNISDYGESGGQLYESAERVIGNNMYLKTGATGLNNENESWIYIGNEFIFSGASSYATVYVTGNYNAYLGVTATGSATAQYNLVAEVYDMENGSRVGSRTIDSCSIAGMADIEIRSGSINKGIPVNFISGHAYKVILKAEAVAKADMLARASIDIYESPYKITLSSIKVGF
ncbi:hypothetical protein [Fusibacter sp. 3D3]|uniref:hypothetical protein n=1 Tax=Fusibacter sp. 3D3 TaxID=1048380 RepID=UPI0008529ACF|nr:hypothetical protein [Fusibacter sp. 3D3]GAU75418.1 hypothetical protein F3D3_0004 [Fusibacter sp. 3D3]